MIQGRDGVGRVVKVITGKGEFERPIQFLYPLELCCDAADSPESKLDANA